MAVAKRKQNKRLTLTEYPAGARQPSRCFAWMNSSGPCSKSSEQHVFPFLLHACKVKGTVTLPESAGLAELEAVDVGSGCGVHSPESFGSSVVKGCCSPPEEVWGLPVPFELLMPLLGSCAELQDKIQRERKLCVSGKPIPWSLICRKKLDMTRVSL